MMPIAQRVEDVRQTAAFTDEAKSVIPKVEKMSQLHHELTKKFDEKGSQLLAKINEKKFSKLSKEYCDWLSSRKMQLEQSAGTGRDVAKSDVTRTLIEEIDEEFATKEDDYKEALEIGKALLQRGDNPNVDKILHQMKEGRSDLNTLLKDQQQFVELVAEFRRFNQEADAIERHISSCRRILPDVSQRLNDEELDDMIKRQGRASAMIESYDKRVATFIESAKSLNPELHIKYEDCMHRKDNIESNWQKLEEDFNDWSQKIEDNKTLLELITTMDDMQQFINEKEKVAQDVTFRDPSHLRNKLKKHEVLAGEVKANGSEMT